MIDKIFPRKLNRSKDARLQDKTEMYDALNISIDDFDGNSESAGNTGDAGVIKPAKGNSALLQSGDLVSEDEFLRVIGSVADEVNNEVYLFVFSSNLSKQGVYKISSSEQVSAVYTSEYFNFQSNGFVKGDIVYKTDGQVMLFFTDGVNEPRKLLILKDESYPDESASAAQKIDLITACPKTPMHPPTFVFSSDPSRPVNFRSVEGFQFAYQCIYKSGEESAISSYSNVAIPPPFFSQGSLSDPLLDAANKIEVSVPRVVNQIENFTENVESIRLLVRIGTEGAFFVVAERSVLNPITNLLETSVDFDFYNDSVFTGVPEEDQSKLNDALPRKALSQTVVNDRLIYGNYEEGYETSQVKATLSTRNIERPEDFVDLRIGIKSLIAPSFDEASSDVEVSLNGDNFDAFNSNSPSGVLNRKSAYQFDLSDLPSVIPSDSMVELSFSVMPDRNFHLYDSLGSFHNFKNNGFGLGLETSDSKSIQGTTRVLHSAQQVGQFENLGNGGQPAVYQPVPNGVHASGLTWKSTDPTASQETTSNIVFGTSPSNPFIIPSELITFKVKFKTSQEFNGSDNVKGLIEEVLVSYFSDNDLALATVDGVDIELIPGDAFQGSTPEVLIDQLMDSSEGYGVISDNDGRSNTVVTCFSDDNFSGAYTSNVPPVGFFAVNKAKAKFALRHSQKINEAVAASSEHNVGPVFTLHIQALSDVETVTMIPRITRSGNKGWIYFTKDFLSDPDNQESVRKVCMYGEDSLPLPENGVGDCNIFFLNKNFAPITDSESDLAEVTQSPDTLADHRIKASYFLNADGLDVLDAQYDGSEFYNNILTFRGYQGTSLVQFSPLPNGISEALTKVGGTELDSDFRVSPGASAYTVSNGYAYGEGLDPDGVGGNAEVSPLKFRNIGYIELNEAGNLIKFADPNIGGFQYSIVDGEVGIRQNYEQGRLNPSYWYGIYYGTQYAGRNNNQFALSEGSTSSSPVNLLHGDFSYKDFDEAEALTAAEKEYPEIETGRNSFSLTSQSFNTGAIGRSFKRNCDHSFAILYYDERGRPGEPVSLGSHFVPQIPDPGLAHVIVNLNSSPPQWAHSYKILYGGNTSVSDFVQYTAGGAFTPKNSEQEKGLIYVSLNYLQENVDVSYSKAFGAVGSDGDKDLYTFSEGDRLRIISYFIDPDNPIYPTPANPLEFQVVGTTTLNDNPAENPLAVEGDEVHPAKTGQFVIIKDNSDASGFSFADVAGSLSDLNTTQNVYDNNNYWNRRCVFEIYSPQKKKEVESRVYHEIGKTYNVVRSANNPATPQHQTSTILIDQGDVYFRKMAVNMQDFDEESNQFVGLIGDGTGTANELTAPNFRSFHLESKAFTDTFPNTDVLPNGKPRVALENKLPISLLGDIIAKPSSNKYVRSSSIKFSDRSNSNSNVVRYTSFNDSKLPFKDLQTNEGEIFFLVNRNDSVFCIQRLKCSSIPVARNILSDALGNETVIATSKVLGTEKYYAGAYGTDAPTSVAEAGNSIYFVSIRNKEVYRFNPSSGIEVISDKGMGSFFDEVLTDAENSPNARVVGGYDPHSDEFIMSSFEGVEIRAAEGDFVFSNAVDNLNVPDATGFEVFEGTGEEDTGGVIDGDVYEVITGLQSDIDNIVDQVNDQDELISGLLSDFESLGDLLNADFSGFSDAQAPIEFVNSVGDTVTIGPFSVVTGYQNAIEAIRISTIEAIQGTILSKIDTLQDLAIERRRFITLAEASSAAISEAKETFSALADVLETLLDSSVDLSEFINEDQLTAFRSIDLLDENNFDSKFNNAAEFSYNNDGVTPLSELAFITPSIYSLSGGSNEIFTVQDQLNIEIPEIDAIAFGVTFTNAASQYISGLQDLSDIPDVSSLVGNIISAAQLQASTEAVETEAGALSSQIEQLELDLENARAARDLASKAFLAFSNLTDYVLGGGDESFITNFNLSEIENLITEADLASSGTIEILDNMISSDEDVGVLLDSFQLVGPSDSLFKTIISDFAALLQGLSGESDNAFVKAKQYLLKDHFITTSDSVFTSLIEFSDGSSSSDVLGDGDESLVRRFEALNKVLVALGQFPAVYLTGTPAGVGGLSPAEMMEWIRNWFDVGASVNEVVPEGTDPSQPGIILDGPTAQDFKTANTPLNISIQELTVEVDDPVPTSVSTITFQQLLNIFRKGLISRSQALQIFVGLKGEGEANKRYSSDLNVDNQISTADLLAFLVGFGNNFSDFGPFAKYRDTKPHPSATNYIIDGDYSPDTLDYQDDDQETISGFD